MTESVIRAAMREVRSSSLPDLPSAVPEASALAAAAAPAPMTVPDDALDAAKRPKCPFRRPPDIRPSSSSLSEWAFSFLPISLNLDSEGRPRGRIEDWLARAGAAHRVALVNVGMTILVGISLFYMADAPLGPTLPRAASCDAIAITGIVIICVAGACLALTHVSYLRLVAAVLPSSAVAPSSSSRDLESGRGTKAGANGGGRSNSVASSADDAPEGGGCAPIPISTQCLFLFGGLLSSQVAIVLLLSQWARLLGLQRNTITLTQVLIVGCETWVSLLQRAEHGLAASVVLWAHHMAVVAVGIAFLDASKIVSDVVYYFLTICWYLSLWLVSRNRDCDAIDDRALENRAAAQAAKCRTLVQARIPWLLSSP